MSILVAVCIAIVAVGMGAAMLRLWDIEHKDLDIRSTHVRRCADCNVRITPDNDSGWQVFVTGNMTQACCKPCMAKRDASEVKLA